MVRPLFDYPEPTAPPPAVPEVRLWLPCVPPKASHHQKRIRRFKTKAGKEIHGLADKPALEEAKLTLEQLLLPHQIATPVPGPVALDLSFTFPWRKDERKRNIARGRIPHTSRLDCSNLAKTFEDRLVVMRFIEDDGQVARLLVEKWWGSQPGIAVVIRTIR